MVTSEAEHHVFLERYARWRVYNLTEGKIPSKLVMLAPERVLVFSRGIPREAVIILLKYLEIRIV